MNAPDSSTSAPAWRRPVFLRVLKWLPVFVVVALLLCWAAMRVRDALQATRRCNCCSLIFQVRLALQIYHSKHRCYPPPYLADETGKPIHSWRALLLPVWEEHCLGGEDVPRYNFEEPWDSPHNRRVLMDHPCRKMFACPVDEDAVALGRTSYVAVVGDNTLWQGQRSGDEVGKITEDTILLVEIPDSDIYWTEPRDISFQQALELFSASKNGLRNSDRHGALHYIATHGACKRFSSIKTVEEFARLLSVRANHKPNDRSTTINGTVK